MRQVPDYLIIGNGRVARHFCRYFSLLNIPVSQWHRSESPERLRLLASRATHILLLISDKAIEPFIREHLQDMPAFKIHFSGSLSTPLAYGAHPLMTFNHSLYTFKKYASIPFVVDDGAPAFENLLPGLPNAHVILSPELKAKYHAMCVMAGNFSCLLWQKFFETMEKEFHLPAETGHPYLRQQMDNLMGDYASAFTGPLARGDGETIQKNLSALEGDMFRRVYQSFVETYQEKKAS